MPPLTPIVQALLLINVAVFCLQSFTGVWVEQFFALWPWGEGFLPWQVVSYAFLHGNFSHIFFNMIGLWMFGSELENLWGPKRFLQFYFASVLTAAAAQLIVTAITPGGPTIGASGGVFGLLVGFGMMFPNRTVMLLIPPMPIKAKYLVMVYGAIELITGYFYSNEGIAHFAHLGGLVGGFLMIRFWRGQMPFGKRR